MTPAQATAMHRRHLGKFETISIRKYTGTGTNRPRFDWDVLARVTDYAAEELAGAIVQGDSKLIVLHDDLVASQYPLPLQTSGSFANLKAIVRGKELSIRAVNDRTRRLGNVVIAYEIAAGG